MKRSGRLSKKSWSSSRRKPKPGRAFMVRLVCTFSPCATSDIIADDPATLADPTVYIWVLYFLALHYAAAPRSSLGPSPNPVRALDLLQRALNHTPTLPELLMGKAKVSFFHL